ncbi:MAG: DNA-binding protein [Anaerolineae bacterium]|nr:DNA-binding protein [Anaerolineae bacterium]
MVEQHKLDEELSLVEEITTWEAASDEDAPKLDELLNQPAEAFHKSLRRVLEKNEELYRRLA